MYGNPTGNWCTPNDDGLKALLARLDAQSLHPDFQFQRERALSLVLEPYVNPQQITQLTPLPEEIALAQLYVFADYLPNNGHSSLIEQIRDLVTEHVPQEERVWLDPLRHSYTDLLTITGRDSSKGQEILHLRSMGNEEKFYVRTMDKTSELQDGQVLLTRLIRHPEGSSLPGAAVVMSGSIGEAVLQSTEDLRREIEVGAGDFALAEWPEFTKRYGYLMMWNLAKVRRGVLAVADSQVEYRNENGQPFLYAIALYEHNDFKFFSEGLSQFKGFEHECFIGSEAPKRSLKDEVTWIQTEQFPEAQSLSNRFPIARLTLTPTQLIAEANSGETLDALKHQLASTFGFSLHFKGETIAPPTHIPPEVDLLSDSFFAPRVSVSKGEEHKLLAEFLESVYLEWAETPCPLLKGETPRHYCAKAGNQAKVASLIDQMEENDLGLRRTGRLGYDYNVLRGHVGL